MSADEISTPTSPERKASVLSRPARLAAAESELRALLDEYQAWRDNLPESLQESGLAVKLDEAIDELTEIVAALADIDLPKGLGRVSDKVGIWPQRRLSAGSNAVLERRSNYLQ